MMCVVMTEMICSLSSFSTNAFNLLEPKHMNYGIPLAPGIRLQSEQSEHSVCQ